MHLDSFISINGLIMGPGCSDREGHSPPSVLHSSAELQALLVMGIPTGAAQRGLGSALALPRGPLASEAASVVRQSIGHSPPVVRITQEPIKIMVHLFSSLVKRSVDGKQ